MIRVSVSCAVWPDKSVPFYGNVPCEILKYHSFVKKQGDESLDDSF